MSLFMNRKIKISWNFRSCIVLICMSWLIFWIAFLATRTSIAPFVGTLWITFSVFVVYVLPFLMFFSLRTFSECQESPVSTQLVRQMIESILMGFVYQILSGYVIQHFIQFNLIQVAAVWIGIPIIVLLVKRLNIAKNFNALIHIAKSSRWANLGFIIVVSSLLVRFPFYITGETGSDTFVNHILTESLVSTGTLSWVINPLSIIQYWPAGAVGSTIIQAGGLTLLSGIPVHEVILVYSVSTGLMSSLLFLLLLHTACRAKIFSKGAIPMTAVLYAFLPLLLKFTDWTLIGRGTFMLVAPAALILILDDIFCTRKRSMVRAASWILVSITLILSHGLGRILIFVFVVLAITDASIRRIRKISFHHKLYTNYPNRIRDLINVCIRRIRKFSIHHKLYSKYPIRIGELIIPGLTIGLFLLPYILFIFGNQTLIGWWVLNRTDLTDFLDATPLGLLTGFLFLFVARLGIAAPLFIFGILVLPKLTPTDMPNLTPFILSIAIFFPFFLNSMYFYQALSFLMVIIAGLTAYCIISRISSQQGNYTIIGLRFPKSHVIRRFLTVCILILCISSTVYIQGTRFSVGMSITNDHLVLAGYLKERVGNENISVFASSGEVSLKVGAFVPLIPIFPMPDTLFLSHFPTQYSNFIYSPISLSPALGDIILFLRYGVVLGRIEDLIDANNFSYRSSEEEFNMIQEKFNVMYLIHDETNEWPLLQMLVDLHRIQLVYSSGEFHLYNISF